VAECFSDTLQRSHTMNPVIGIKLFVLSLIPAENFSTFMLVDKDAERPYQSLSLPQARPYLSAVRARDGLSLTELAVVGGVSAPVLMWHSPGVCFCASQEVRTSIATISGVLNGTYKFKPENWYVMDGAPMLCCTA